MSGSTRRALRSGGPTFPGLFRLPDRFSRRNVTISPSAGSNRRMGMILKLVCVQCGANYKEGEVDTCPKCGMDEGILDVQFDLARARETLSRKSLAERTKSHWRYRELLPL